jgi:hypothetical protein
MDDVVRLFPTPFMRAKQTLESELVAALVQDLLARATRNDASSKNSAHTQMLEPADNPLLEQVAARVLPKLVDFGVCSFGERPARSRSENAIRFSGLAVACRPVLAQGAAQITPRQADNAAEGAALQPVTRRVVGRQRAPTSVFDPHQSAFALSYQGHLDDGFFVWFEVHILPFQSQPLRRF